MMKKLFTMALMVFVLFALTACSGNGDTSTTPTPEAQEPPTTQNQPTDATSPATPTTANDGTIAFGVPFLTGDYYDVEVTFHPNFSVVTHDGHQSVHRLVDGEQVIDRVSELIKFPITITNTSDRQRGPGAIIFLSPYADQVERRVAANPFQLNPVQANIIQRAYDENHVSYTPIPAGETIETHIFIPFLGDGNYLLFVGGRQPRFMDVAVYR